MVSKKCPNCEEKIKKDFGFCPYCGSKLNSNSRKKYGLLGKNDFLSEREEFSLPSFGGGMLNKMIGSAMKMLEKEFEKEFQKQERPKTNTRIKLMINGKEITPTIKREKIQDKTPRKNLPINFSLENLKKFQKMDKKEPKTQMRRIGDKLTYELDVPGVESINDISIIKLENGIEINALAKKNAYSKKININLPLIKYMLAKEKIFLELDTSADSQNL